MKTKRQIAFKIADRLFSDFNKRPVQRLVLVIHEGCSQRMSGWCKAAIFDIIMDEFEPFKLTPNPTKKGRKK